MAFFDLFSSKNKKKNLDASLEKTKTSLFSKIGKAVAGKDKIDEEVLDNIEEALIAADVGVETTIKIIERLEKRVKKDKYISTKDIDTLLKEEILDIISLDKQNYSLIPKIDKPPYIILVVGVNGVGKTTTIGKLASFFKNNNKSVLLGAADTFRAAAVDQLTLWAQKVGVPIVSHGMNTDPGSVAFDAVKKGVEENYDVVLIDTAGRLHNKVGLMNELGKIKRIIQKFIPEGPHDIMLVLDGSTGQNAFVQVKEFKEITDVSCLTITKLDGTAKGGVIIGIISEYKLPIKFIGTGEKVDDIQLFDPKEFVDSLFETKN